MTSGNSSVQHSADRRAEADPCRPRWLERELRSDHAGETGAVQIYRGILAVSRDSDVRDFAARHIEAERRHLELIEDLLPVENRSRLLVLWRIAGFVTGALPALFGARAVYSTIDAVETFVDLHYGAQIDALCGQSGFTHLVRTLSACRDDEIKHRDEARTLAPPDPGLILRFWSSLVGLGSAAGVSIARRL